MPTATLEEYLESIYRLSADEASVRPTQIAEAVGVSGPTVTATLRRLEAQGFVVREGTSVVLTPVGRERAIDILRRHRVAESFLVDTLGLEWDVAHEEACLLEHALSPRVVVALEKFLDNPTSCPHGHPIPAADGSVSAERARPAPLRRSRRRGLPRFCVCRKTTTTSWATWDHWGFVPARTSASWRPPRSRDPLTVDVKGIRTALSREIAALVTVALV